MATGSLRQAALCLISSLASTATTASEITTGSATIQSMNEGGD